MNRWRSAGRVVAAAAADRVPDHASTPAIGVRSPTSCRRVSSNPSLPHWLQIELRRPLGHPATEHEAVLAGAAKVDAGVDARVGALARRLREAREGTRDAVEGLAAREG